MAEPPKKPAADETAFRRANAPRALGQALGRVTRPVFRQRGVALAEIVGNWPAIAGPLLAAETQPERLVYAGGAGHGATLEIGVSSAFALELQHLAPLIVDKVNGYFGYRAVEKLRLKQMPIRPTESAAAPDRQVRPLDAAEAAQLAAMLAGVEDRKLRQALESLGRSLLGAVP